MLNENKLEDVLNCDPISKRGISALRRLQNYDNNIKLNVNNFYNDIYVEPFFCNEKDSNQLTINDEIGNDDFAFSQTKTEHRQLENKKNTYEDHFLSKTTDKFLLIRGSSGSGKTTYLNYLIMKRGGKSIYFDLENSLIKLTKGYEEFPHINEPLPSTNGIIPSPPWLFLILLLEKAIDIILDIIKKNDIGIFMRIKENFIFIYGNNYSDKTKKIFDVFQTIHECDNSEYNINNSRILEGDIFRTLIDLCVPNHENASICIINTLEIMTRILLCSSDLDNPIQTLITFDSIEHYIDVGRRIYDVDVRVIADSVFSFTQNEEVYYRGKNLEFAKFFKVVMVVRDTTNQMFSTNVHNYFSQYINNSINITCWYNPEDFYSKKIAYFRSKIPEISPSFRFFKSIVSDKSAPNSIMKLISIMYNFNKRRISRILAKIASVFTDIDKNPERNTKVLTLDKYESFWDNKNISTTYRYLPRRSILRLILNMIKETGFFRSILVEGYPLNNANTTLARRVLIWLSRKTDVKDEYYVSFYELIEEVLRCIDLPKGTVEEKDIEVLSKILIAMEEFRFESDDTNVGDIRPYNLRPNRWCQLIVIKYNDNELKGNLTADILYKKMLEIYELKSTDSNEFGIKITHAGCFFTYIQSAFEYFACRYDDNNSLPLLFMLDITKIKKTITCVFERAKKCIDHVLMHEYSFSNGNFNSLYNREFQYRHITESKNVVEMSFPLRIIKNHRNYLSEYKKIIGLNLIFDNENDKKDVVEHIDKYMKEYENLFKTIKNNKYVINDKKIVDYFRENDSL